MSDYIINGSTLSSIANAIRSKTGSTASMTPTQMPTQIEEIGMVNYSTDEQVIGTWIDGKPLYSKTISNIAITGTNVDDVNIGLDATAQIEYFTGYVFNDDNEPTRRLPLTFVHPVGLNYSYTYTFLKNKLSARRGSDIGKHYVTVTVYYIKTTD